MREPLFLAKSAMKALSQKSWPMRTLSPQHTQLVAFPAQSHGLQRRILNILH